MRKPELTQIARRRQSGLAPRVGWHLEVLTLIQELPPLPLEESGQAWSHASWMRQMLGLGLWESQPLQGT